MVVVFLNWSIVFFDFLKNLQYCVSFRYTAQWFRYIFFSDSFPFWLFQYIEYSSLCCTVNPCCLSESRSGSQSCPTLSDLIDCSLPGFSVHEIPQARILEWVAIPFSRGSSQLRGSHPSLLHCRQVLYHLSHQGSPPEWWENKCLLFKPCSMVFYYGSPS